METEHPLPTESRPTAAPTNPPAIHTPDQRLRVFVSSTLDELAPERAAAREAISQLRQTPVLFESGARPYPPRELYRAYLAQSDIFIGLYWQRYGWVAPGMQLSGLEDEYQLSVGKPKLIYIKTPAPEREPGLQALLDRVRKEDIASYQKFATPEELAECIANDLAQLLTERFTSTPETPVAARLAPLPVPRSRLIGREQELAQAQALLQQQDVGLVTLTGPGGVGKTRLALQVAADLAPQFADGVAFIALAALKDPRLLVPTVARALGLAESGNTPLDERLFEYLRPRQQLLVLDNAEQLVAAAAPLAAQALEQAPQLKLLVTSREPLRIRDEWLMQVPPLALADPAHLPDLEHLVQTPAVALLIECACEANPAFALTSENAATIVELCQRLDGLPLALELAAARLSLLTPAALLARLERRLPLLTRGARDLPARQQTLRNTIAWSYDLLVAGEQQLFRRLAVFVVGFTLEAVQAVCFSNATGASSPAQADEEGAVLEQLAQLLEKSLVQEQRGMGGEPRFTMLETIREYAREQLVASGEEAAVQERHAHSFLQLAEEAEPHLLGAEQGKWLARLEQEHENLRAALTFLLERAVGGTEQAEQALRLCTALQWFWYIRGYVREGGTLLERALTNSEGVEAPVRGKALYAAAQLVLAQDDYERAGALLEESLALSRELGDPQGIASSLTELGSVALARSQYTRARSLLEEAEALYKELGYSLGRARCLIELARVCTVQGEYARARALLEESLVLVRAVGEQTAHSWVLCLLARLLFVSQSDLAQARSLAEESLALLREAGNRWTTAYLLTLLGQIVLRQGDEAQARALAEESVAILKEIGDRSATAEALLGFARVLVVQGDLDAARRLSLESLAILRKVGNKDGTAACLECLAAVLAAQGAPGEAARLWGTAKAIREAIGAPMLPIDRADYERAVAVARTELGEEAFAKAWVEGSTLPLERVLDEVLR